ncbi:MAG: glutamine synthetase [Clostridia bacterium]|nr:glutamine synthetase [Clostridia bacterium]
MNYSKDEVLQYVSEEDVKFIRLAFCDVFGKQKNISIMPDELPRAFEQGIAFDASAIPGFGDGARSDLFLHPEPETLMPLPWRPEHGRVVQMFSGISGPEGEPFACDTRLLLKKAVGDAKKAGVDFTFGAELEFYLFRLDEMGRPTKIPCDEAGYMDIAPDDRGENVRREICLTLEQMGIRPESSHHEEGPGQNEIDFRYSDALTAADSAMTFQRVVKTVADRNGLIADFSPKPIGNAPGNGFHINMSVRPFGDGRLFSEMIAGVLANVGAMTAFLNPSEASYRRLGRHKAPLYVSWSAENRSQLVRIPAAVGEFRRAELRSPDPTANPYLAFTLMIRAGLDGIERKLVLCPPSDINLFSAGIDELSAFGRLPGTIDEARAAAASSDFIRKHIPPQILSVYCGDRRP